MFERRLHILLAVLFVISGLIAVRAVAVQAVGRGYWSVQAEKRLADVREIATTRGRILDVKGRELAVDKPCVDACVHYEAVAFTHTLAGLRDAAVTRLMKSDATFMAQDVPEKRRRVEAEIGRVIIEESGVATIKWLRGQARRQVRREHEDYDELPLKERWRLLNAGVCRTVASVETMWRDLARASHQSDDDMDELRRQIVRRVETRRRLVWYGRYQEASQSKEDLPWYVTLMGGGGPADLDKFDVHVSEERDAHVILPHIDYALRNQLARRADDYPGLVLREGVIRTYPYASVAAQTIGRIAKVMPEDLEVDPRKDDPLGKYAATDDIGREGLERLFEQTLRGTRGRAGPEDDDESPPDAADRVDTPPATVVDETLGDSADKDAAAPRPPTPGRDVQTTIDAALQNAVEQSFKKIEFVRSVHLPTDLLDMPGAAVLIDLPTGEVRAMVSWPTYDLNTFDEAFPTLSRDQLRRPLQNRATRLAVEPGSTVKPIVGISAITAGVFGPHETIHCDGYVVVNGRQHKDFGRCWTIRLTPPQTHRSTQSPHPTGDLTFPDAIQRSCNVFHEELAYKLGLGGLSQWYNTFGLGRPVGVGLPEASGTLPDTWHGRPYERMSATCMAGIGQGPVAATPLQMANVAATIARDGVAVRPTLLKGDRQPPVDLHLNKEAVAEAKAGMYAVVNTPGGTGRAAEMDDVIVAAKTGSAQTGPLRIPVRDDQNKPVRDADGRVRYEEIAMGTHAAPNPKAPWYRAIGQDEQTRPAHGWMIGYAPADKPKFAFAVLVEYGGGGGPAAGTVVKAMMEACRKQGYLP